MGSYSCPTLNRVAGIQDFWKHFTDPVKASKTAQPTLHFAGEAYYDAYSGYIQGAYFSAEKTANDIM